MAPDATIARVARPRGTVTPKQAARLQSAKVAFGAARDDYQSTVVAVLTEGASFAEVSKATGLSTNTLQRWKREAGK